MTLKKKKRIKYCEQVAFIPGMQGWFNFQKSISIGTSLAAQWLRLHAPNAGGTGSRPGRGTKIPHATWQA